MAARRPKRIQRKRVKGWHMPPNTIYVGRPTAFGNPYRLEFYRFEDASGRPTKHVASAREMAVRDFRMWLGVNPQGEIIAARAKRELRGKNLACWCRPGQPCHADVLLEIANG